MTEAEKKANEKLVDDYFQAIKDLRAGDPSSVEQLVGMWDEDGVFEFAGSPPITGIFRGRMAIHTLYKNRLLASGMPVRLKATGKRADQAAALGVVATEVDRRKTMESKIVAGWTTTIGTQDGRGFRVSGSHSFQFKDGKISALKVVVSPQPEATKDLRLEGLSVEDIGRLALAAWPVV
ncbi:MAG: nuclear transport factor 2 family protein [Holophagaceae bacterium]|nr:nuclear transport factor 2 family protein [Holophagaceae bacterium]